MPRITPIHHRIFEKFLKYIGCVYVGTEGDHVKYKREDLNRPIIITKDKDLPVFIIKNNLRILKIPRDQYLEILKQL